MKQLRNHFYNQYAKLMPWIVCDIVSLRVKWHRDVAKSWLPTEFNLLKEISSWNFNRTQMLKCTVQYSCLGWSMSLLELFCSYIPGDRAPLKMCRQTVLQCFDWFHVLFKCMIQLIIYIYLRRKPDWFYLSFPRVSNLTSCSKGKSV